MTWKALRYACILIKLTTYTNQKQTNCQDFSFWQRIARIFVEEILFIVISARKPLHNEQITVKDWNETMILFLCRFFFQIFVKRIEDWIVNVHIPLYVSQKTNLAVLQIFLRRNCSLKSWLKMTLSKKSLHQLLAKTTCMFSVDEI